MKTIKFICAFVLLSTAYTQNKTPRLPISSWKLQELLHRLDTAEISSFFAFNHHAFALDSTQ